MTANIILNSEKLKAFPLRSGTRQRCLPIPTTICQHSFGSPSHSNQRRKRNKRNPDQKRRKILTAYDMILYIGNAKDTTRKLLDLINEYHKVVEYKINTQKVLAFLYTNNEKSEREIKQTISYTIATKRIKYLGINLPQETKKLYAEKCKTLMKEVKDDTEMERYTMFLDWKNQYCENN